MLTKHNPLDLTGPLALIAQGVEAPPGARWLVTSGQVAIGADGAVPEGTEAQLEDIWDKLLAILDAAGMTAADIVKVNCFLTDAADVPVWRHVRDRKIPGVKPAATLLVVAALASPQFKVEIEVIAAA